eukprot:gene10718-biopygen10809
MAVFVFLDCLVFFFAVYPGCVECKLSFGLQAIVNRIEKSITTDRSTSSFFYSNGTIDAKMSGDGTPACDEGIQQWNKQVVGTRSREVLLGGASAKTIVTHTSWYRFSGTCKPMCGSEAFWLQLTLDDCTSEQLKDMAFKNHMPVGDFRTPHNYTAAMQKWWLQDRGEPVQLRTGVLPARQLDETRLSIRACESTLTPGFESFSPGRRGTRQREKQAPDSSSASKRRKRQEDAKREEAKRGGNNREAGNGHPVQDKGDATQDAANEAMPKDLRAMFASNGAADETPAHATDLGNGLTPLGVTADRGRANSAVKSVGGKARMSTSGLGGDNTPRVSRANTPYRGGQGGQTWFTTLREADMG